MSGRRFNGEGTVYQVESTGLWRAAVTLPGGRRKYVSAKSRSACDTKLQAVLADLGAGRPTGASERLGPFLEWWLTTVEAKAASRSKSPNTVDNARWAVRKWIVPRLGGKRLRDLTPEHVEALLAEMAAAGLSRSSVNRVRVYLGQALTVAERRGAVARNVAHLAEMPATRPPGKRRSLTEAQAKALLAAASEDRLEGLLLAGLMLGLRPGELTGLVWEDVDLKRRLLHVESALKNERGHLHRGDTKTAHSRRVLTLPAPVVAALGAHRNRQTEERRSAGSAWKETGYVFTTPIGTPLDPSNLRAAFGKLTTSAGLGHWTPNELRHSAASLLSAAGVPLEEIADILGHSSTRMLEVHYRHRLRPAVDAHVEVMEGLFAP